MQRIDGLDVKDGLDDARSVAGIDDGVDDTLGAGECGEGGFTVRATHRVWTNSGVEGSAQDG